MTYRRGFALAFVAFSTACGGDGGTGELRTVGSEPPPFNEQAPFEGPEQPIDSFDSPGNDTEQPLPNSDAPPVGNSPAGAVSPSVCQDICSAFLDAGCELDGTLSECVAGCSNPDPEEAQCFNEIMALFACIAHAPDFACVDGDFDLEIEFINAHCPNEAAAYFQCNPPEITPQPTACTLEGGCQGCTDSCSACLCTFANDASLCTDVCI